MREAVARIGITWSVSSTRCTRLPARVQQCQSDAESLSRVIANVAPDEEDDVELENPELPNPWYSVG